MDRDDWDATDPVTERAHHETGRIEPFLRRKVQFTKS
jgi:hypothetical protein